AGRNPRMRLGSLPGLVALRVESASARHRGSAQLSGPAPIRWAPPAALPPHLCPEGALILGKRTADPAAAVHPVARAVAHALVGAAIGIAVTPAGACRITRSSTRWCATSSPTGPLSARPAARRPGFGGVVPGAGRVFGRAAVR